MAVHSEMYSEIKKTIFVLLGIFSDKKIKNSRAERIKFLQSIIAVARQKILARVIPLVHGYAKVSRSWDTFIELYRKS